MSFATHIAVFVYGKTQGDEWAIVARDAAEKMKTACNCRTWGDYAALCGEPWAKFLEDSGGEIQDLTGLENPGPDAPFEFLGMYGAYYVGDLIPEPRTAAYDILAKLPKAVREDPRLRELIEWSGGSPAGHIASVAAKSEEAVRLFERVIHEAGYEGYRFERDDALIQLVAG